MKKKVDFVVSVIVIISVFFLLGYFVISIVVINAIAVILRLVKRLVVVIIELVIIIDSFTLELAGEMNISYFL